MRLSMMHFAALLISGLPLTVEAAGPPYIGPYQTGLVSGEGWSQVLWYNYASGESEAQSVTQAPYIFGYPVPERSWVGLFLYDYAYAQFSWGMYSYKEPLPVVL